MKIWVAFTLNCCPKTYYVTYLRLLGVDGQIKSLADTPDLGDGDSLTFSGFELVCQVYTIESVVFVCHIQVGTVNYESAGVWTRSFHFFNKQGEVFLIRLVVSEFSFIVWMYKL